MSRSATVSNAEEFGSWLEEVRGDTAVIVSEHRPVPLWQHMMVGQTLFDLFVEELDDAEAFEGPTGRHRRAEPGHDVSVNPDLVHAIRGTEGRPAYCGPGLSRSSGGRAWSWRPGPELSLVRWHPLYLPRTTIAHRSASRDL